ncbi:MAG: DUF4190 domain-containing protein [Thiotrichaceae bacterium]|nr:DUF4190 domain-containing protein [Thiotrichaceae bacterium]
MSDHRTGLAFTSLFLGFLSLIPFLGFFTSILGIITSHIARSRAYQFPYQYGGSGIALWGMMLSYLSFFFHLFIFGMAIFLHTNGDLMPLVNAIDPTGELGDATLEALSWVPFL